MGYEIPPMFCKSASFLVNKGEFPPPSSWKEILAPILLLELGELTGSDSCSTMSRSPVVWDRTTSPSVSISLRVLSSRSIFVLLNALITADNASF